MAKLNGSPARVGSWLPAVPRYRILAIESSSSGLAGANAHALGLELVGLGLAAGAGERPAAPGDLHVDEAAGLDEGDVLSFLESAPDSGRPDPDVRAARRRDVSVDDDVGDLQATARLQDPERLAEHGSLVRREVDDAVGDDEVGGSVLDRQRLGVSLTVLDLAKAGERDALAAAFQHCRRHVHGNDPAGAPDRLRGEEAV